MNSRSLASIIDGHTRNLFTKTVEFNKEIFETRGYGTSRARNISIARKLGEHATARLKEMQNQYELIGDIRGPGLMIGIELVKDRKTKIPGCEEAHKFIKMGLERGVIYGESKYNGLGNIVKIKPPLVTTEAQLERALDVFEEIVQRLSDE